MCKAQSARYFNGIFHVYFRDGAATTDNYSIRKALDFTKQVLEYLYLVEKYPHRLSALQKRIKNENYEQKIAKLCKSALDDTHYSYKQFLE